MPAILPEPLASKPGIPEVSALTKCWKRALNVPEGMRYTFIDHQALIPWFRRFFEVPPELLATTIGTVDPERTLRALRSYLPAFFDRHLRGRRSPPWNGASPRHPDVRFIA
jgi:hypothetical protein